MNDGNEPAWGVFWGICLIATLAVLPGAAQEGGAAAGTQVGVLLAFEVFMLALPSLWNAWVAGRPARERRRVEARERAAGREQVRSGREEARRQRMAEERARREARAAEERRRREANTARAEAEAYYRAHAPLLADVLPPALFRAEAATTFAPDAAPEAAWQASRDLIARMQPLVRQAEERRREEEKRRQRLARQLADIDEQVRAHEARIARVRASGLDPDAIEDEVAALNQAVEQLQERRRGLELEGE